MLNLNYINDVIINRIDNEYVHVLRQNNWIENLTIVDANDITLVVGNHLPDGRIMPTSLENYLKNIGNFSSTVGIPVNTNMYNQNLDMKFYLRYQIAFIPRAKSKTFCQKIMAFSSLSKPPISIDRSLRIFLGDVS